MIMIWCFTSFSTLYKSYRDDGRVIIKGSVQLRDIQWCADFCLWRDLNPESHDQKRVSVIISPSRLFSPG